MIVVIDWFLQDKLVLTRPIGNHFKKLYDMNQSVNLLSLFTIHINKSIMANARTDFVGPILLAIFAYLASMITRAFQRSVDSSAYLKKMKLDASLNYTIYDNFITDDNLLQKLQDESLWIECSKQDPMWWDGESEPKTIWEELSKAIWSDRPELKDAVGIEYWCNRIDPDQGYLPWHIDKDEIELTENNKLVTPIMGSVLYGFNHDGHFTGGKLLLVDADVNDDPTIYETLKIDEIVQIDPLFNRMLIFNASKWHQVSLTTGTGARYTFAANANRQKPKSKKR